jgi:starvation-inducible DNA-binding protein
MYAMPTQTGLDEEARHRISVILNQVLADEFALSTATRDYHWTVTGPHFRSLCELFDEQYRQLDQWLERIMDRARSMGVTVHTGWRDLTESSHFTPMDGAALNPRGMISALIALHVRMLEQLREDMNSCNAQVGHRVLAELLKELLEYHETTAWLLTELLEDRELAQA